MGNGAGFYTAIYGILMLQVTSKESWGCCFPRFGNCPLNLGLGGFVLRAGGLKPC